MTASFSGAHPFRPQCLLDAFGNPDDDLLTDVIRLIEGVDRGECPRCRGPLPQAPGLPAGSRLTRCRCIPVCGPCGDHEGIPASWRANYIGAEVDDLGWLIDPAEREEERAAFYAAHPPQPAILGPAGVLVTEDGAGPIAGRPRPGGWAEFGFDDTADVAERMR